jgi:hypothetical protein
MEKQMRNSKHGFKALVLAMMAALGVMAFSAVGAQAQSHELLLLAKTHELHLLVLDDETNPNPLPKPSETNSPGTFTVDGNVPAGQGLKGKQLGNGYLLVAARDLKIECTGGTVTAANVNNSTDAKATVTFTGCVANNHAGTPLKDCLFKELETIKASALALPILHGGQKYVLFEPLEGENFTTVSFKEGTVCTLPLNNPVKGSVVAKVDALEGTVQTLLFNEAIQLLVGDVLKYGALANTSYVNGHADVEVEGVEKELGVH